MADDDPYAPDWTPEYTGNTSLGEVGAGQGFGSDLFELYRAGRKLFPVVAKHYETLHEEVQGLREPATAILRIPGHYQPAHSHLLRLRSDLQRILRTSCMAIHDTGTALVDTAATYASTDEEAAAEFSRRMEQHRDDYRDPPFTPDLS